MVLSMDRWVGKVAIVTGASSGIGEAVSERLVGKGMLYHGVPSDPTLSVKCSMDKQLCVVGSFEHNQMVVGVARRKERLDALAERTTGKKGKFYPIQGDVSKEEDILKLFNYTIQNLGPIHVLVNNAGVGCKSAIQDGKTEDWLETINVNLVGLCIGTREALRNMIENNIDGYIFNINSILGHSVLPLPKSEIYTATKHGVTAITEFMRKQVGMQKKKIKFTSISPGAVDTEIIAAALSHSGASQYLNKDMPMLKSEDIADAIEYALSTPPHVQVHEVIIRPTGDVS